MTYDPEQEPYVALRTKALESLLIEKGLLTAEAVDERISEYERDIGPLKGARVVARAWVDPGLQGAAARRTAPRDRASSASPAARTLVVVENTPAEHHMVVCTLCSCYPWMVLGSAADLVQELRLPLARRDRAARGAARVRAGARRGGRRSTSGTAAPRCATWCCRSARPAPRD